MNNISKYRVWCNIENMYYEIWSETEPVSCPNNSGHDIDITKTTVIEKISDTYETSKSNKLIIHDSPRPFGTKVHFTGCEDDVSIADDVGHGSQMYINHKIDDSISEIKYLDLNTIDNPTYIQEGYIQWYNALLDTVTVEVVPNIVNFEMASNNTYLWDGVNPIVVPASLNGGIGNVNILSDLTENTGGLVQMVEPFDKSPTPPGYWDADWNTETGLFENISPAPAGNGQFNIFLFETVMTRFMNGYQLLGSNCIHIDTNDRDALGHGMRIKIISKTNIDVGPDHDWIVGCNFKLYRVHSTCKFGT